MAYASTELVARIRAELKETFPASKGWKFSVRKGSGSLSVNVSVVTFPKGYNFLPESINLFDPNELHWQVNHYHIDSAGLGKKETAALKKINEIMHREHWDKSDIMTDYFHCAYYTHLEIGKWNKGAVAVSPKKPATKARKARKTAKPAASKMSVAQAESIASFIGINF